MTYSEGYLKIAVKALIEGSLDKYETDFIRRIKDFDKNRLRDLSRQQFMLLRKIADKNG